MTKDENKNKLHSNYQKNEHSDDAIVTVCKIYADPKEQMKWWAKKKLSDKKDD